MIGSGKIEELKQFTSVEIISDIENSLAANTEVDMIEIDIKKVWELLGTLIGETYDDELIDNLFNKFCLGK